MRHAFGCVLVPAWAAYGGVVRPDVIAVFSPVGNGFDSLCAEYFLAFVGVTAALICHRRLTK